MCGRYTLTRPRAEIGEALKVADVPDWQPSYNIAPTRQVLVVREGKNGSEIALLRWGLVPSWSAGGSAEAPLINARAETAAEKPAFRAAFKSRRCLVPADGFFEWKTQGRKKLPHLFTLAGGALFTVAGLWESWERDGLHLESVCLLTTEANELVRGVHDRMPVIVPVEARQDWLRPGCNLEELRPLLRPYPASAMACRPVNQAVNNARNEGPSCIEPAGTEQRSLF